VNRPHLKTICSAAFLLSGLILWPLRLATAQIPARGDSLKISKLDSLALAPLDSARADTVRQQSDLDAPIDYEAQMIDNFVETRVTVLTGRAKVKYKTMTLEAGKITVDWNAHLLVAEPLPDSLVDAGGVANGKGADGASDSLAKAERGVPVFSDGSDVLTGARMEYNFATEKGRVLRGRTEFQDGKYFGTQIKRADSKTLFVSKGIYSTCDDEDHPHFHFWSRKMKVVLQENVVAKPIVLFIGKIPVMALPFGFFPTRSGRHSGLIIPRYGASTTEGRYLRELGYYWAINDYLDAKSTVDYYENSGWFFRGDVRYAKRYSFSGSLGGSLTRKNFQLEGSQERRWDLTFNHSQQLGPTARLAASGSFASSNNFYRFFSSDRQQQLRRNVISQATYSKSFGGGSNSLSFSLRDSKDLQNGTFDRVLPQLSLSFGQRQLFGGRQSSKPALTGGGAKTEERSWYENFYYNYAVSAQNRYTKTQTSDTTTKVDHLSSANHNLNFSLNSPKRYFGWLYLNQSMQVNEDWFDRTTNYATDSARKQIVSAEKKGFAARHLFNYSISANTKIYGTFQPNLGPVRALRHVVTPSLGFSYRPDFSDPRWGYFERVTLQGSRGDSTVRRDRFGGSTPSGKVASMNFSVGNLFQMKTGPEDKPKKIDLFNLNFSTSHNFAAKEFKQSDLSSSLFANPAQNLSVSLGASHSFYVFDRQLGRTVNQFLYKKHGIFSGRYLRLTNINLGANFRLQSKRGEAGSAEAPPPAEEPTALEGALPVVKDRFAPQQFFSDTAVPWQASFSLTYNYNRFDPRRPVKTAQLSVDNAEIKLTKNWRLGMSGQFDLREKRIVDQRYTIHRDLHCWEMQFFWTPTGFSKGFYFRLGIKAPLLQDIKLERRGGRTTVFGGSYY
jgi:lipopolysaccharide assembly outer membrane protein LptD (OstA)